jgi:hypothetical protein
MFQSWFRIWVPARGGVVIVERPAPFVVAPAPVVVMQPVGRVCRVGLVWVCGRYHPV